ncbi:MAG: response regulator [Clostridium sp.]|uniref:response regulator transcription factor n=1 Tax=Clostridium sp. DSM 8431 TaxID=1761781 RepID=UPI0008E7498C|nr:helix-turn-helix domain-containing protein [Clostridium sp. DSM 8431]MCR4943075.1 response regulator [Clostridium sp.]SFU56228.1 two-component system, response regulator YesN [Clostridium sp. DSM 8431]
MRILVVDDDKIIRFGLAKKIKRLFADYEVISDFANGSMAFKYLEENPSEVVITDIKMPVMTGVQLIEKAKKTLEKPPIFIVLSGYDDFSYVRDSMKCGAVNYLLKPVVEKELIKTLKEAEKSIILAKEKENVINHSISILQKDFFRYLLFGKKSLNIRDEKVLNSVYLNENNIYKMVVINSFCNISKEINEFKNYCVKKYDHIKFTYYLYKSSIYIVFYFKDYDKQKFQEELLMELESFLGKDIGVFSFENTKDVWALRDMAKLAEKFSGSKAQGIHFLSLDRKPEESSEYTEKKTSNISIKLAKEYIKNNYYKNISLKDVAEEIFLSQNYLSDLFKRETGEGFYEFLSNYRINKAKEILKTTNLKIYEVAEKVGYSDSITFGRAFKKKMGTTPNNYRNSSLDNGGM